MPADHYESFFTLALEADSVVPVVQEGSLFSGGSTYRAGKPDNKFAIDAPDLVLTDKTRSKKLNTELDKAMEGPHFDGIFAVGEKPVGMLVEDLARRELQLAATRPAEFGRSKALLALTYFRRNEHQLAPSSATFIREAGQRVVSALIAGTYPNKNDTVYGRGIGPTVERLGGIEFRQDDHESIAMGVMARMRNNGSLDAFESAARANGSSVENYVGTQTAGFMKHVLGVEV